MFRIDVSSLLLLLILVSALCAWYLAGSALFQAANGDPLPALWERNFLAQAIVPNSLIAIFLSAIVLWQYNFFVNRTAAAATFLDFVTTAALGGALIALAWFSPYANAFWLTMVVVCSVSLLALFNTYTSLGLGESETVPRQSFRLAVQLQLTIATVFLAFAASLAIWIYGEYLGENVSVWSWAYLGVFTTIMTYLQGRFSRQK